MKTLQIQLQFQFAVAVLLDGDVVEHPPKGKLGRCAKTIGLSMRNAHWIISPEANIAQWDFPHSAVEHRVNCHVINKKGVSVVELFGSVPSCSNFLWTCTANVFLLNEVVVACGCVVVGGAGELDRMLVSLETGLVPRILSIGSKKMKSNPPCPLRLLLPLIFCIYIYIQDISMDIMDYRYCPY